MTSINRVDSTVRTDPQQGSISLNDITDGVRKVYDYFARDPWKLPVIVLAWPLLFLSACSRKTAVSENRNPSPDFDESGSPLAYRLYQGLLSSGVSPASIDSGYQIINYNNTYCPGRGPSCLLGAGDNLIKPEEVFEYALNNYTRHRALIEDTLGDPIPWELDDLNPATSFDAEIRNKITDAINTLKGILAEKGYTEGTGEYKKGLAMGLYLLIAMPEVENIPYVSDINDLKAKMESSGIGPFFDYLLAHGGVRLYLNNDREYSALDALQNEKGNCSEFSKILFSVFGMAGLEPKYVMVKLRANDVDNIIDHLTVSEERRNTFHQYLLEAIGNNPYINHVCVGLELEGRFRLFDAMFLQEDARYGEYFPVTPRQYLSMDYSNQAVGSGLASSYESSKEALDKAVLLDPMSAMNYMNYGIFYKQSHDFDRAIEYCSKALAIDPFANPAYYERGTSYFKTGDYLKCISDLTRFLEYPQAVHGDTFIAAAYFYRGLSFLQEWQLDKSIADLSAYLKMEPESHVQLKDKMQINYPAYLWEGNSDAENFSRETGLVFTRVDVQYIFSRVLWLAGLRDLAREQFRVLIADNLTISGTPSAFTVNYFEEMFRNMPEDMREDEQISGMIDSIRQKLQQ